MREERAVGAQGGTPREPRQSMHLATWAREVEAQTNKNPHLDFLSLAYRCGAVDADYGR